MAIIDKIQHTTIKSTPIEGLKAKDFASDQEVRWCPGCGDYSILKQVQSIMPESGYPKENTVFISGIGCSSRFPYYMDTFGIHSIHGRAPAIASGLKVSRPELNVWVITGDGDALSIGGNHLIHALRRNVDLNIILFNNQIYGLTKGQYSPTSELGKHTKSSPYGTIDNPFNPLALVLGAQSGFVARGIDRNTKHLKALLAEAQAHKGTSFVEVYQNCNVFNDHAFELFTDKETKDDTTLYLEHGKPMIFGKEDDKGIILENLQPKVVKIGDKYSIEDLWIHDKHNLTNAWILSQFFDRPENETDLPRPFGVFYVAKDKPIYEELLHAQLDEVKKQKPNTDLQQLLTGNNAYEVW